MAEKKTGGLEGVIAGSTAISTVGKQGVGLTYRGYSIEDLADHSTFEEVAYLLIYGQLPTADELDEYKARLRNLRGLPATLKTVLEQIPASAHPMDVLRTGCSMLGTLEPENAGRTQIAVANRLTACFSGMLLYWHHFVTSGKRIRHRNRRRQYRRPFSQSAARQEARRSAPPRHRCFADSLRRA